MRNGPLSWTSYVSYDLRVLTFYVYTYLCDTNTIAYIAAKQRTYMHAAFAAAVEDQQISSKSTLGQFTVRLEKIPTHSTLKRIVCGLCMSNFDLPIAKNWTFYL